MARQLRELGFDTRDARDVVRLARSGELQAVQLIRQAERSLRGTGAASGDRRRNLFFSMTGRRGSSPDGAAGRAARAGDVNKAFDGLLRWKL